MNPLAWLEWIVSWILVAFHTVTGAVLGPANGWAWALAIVGLVVVIRILLIPLFVKQIKSQRNLQLIQPQMKEIQKKYAGDRERQSQELMKLYKETGTNPLSSCLPILLQAPIFFALFRVLQGIAQDVPYGVLSAEQVSQARAGSIFGAPLYATFVHADEVAAAGFSPVSTRIVTIVLIILMTVTTFTTQRQLIVKNMAADNPVVRQQKILLYVFPLIFAVSGINFPIGVLIYWFTTNLWSMGQQFYVIRNNPQPNTPAYEAWERRRREKDAHAAVRRGEAATVEEALEPPAPPPPPRVQPKRQSRSKRTAPGLAKGPGSPAAGTASAAAPAGTGAADRPANGTVPNGAAPNGAARSKGSGRQSLAKGPGRPASQQGGRGGPGGTASEGKPGKAGTSGKSGRTAPREGDTR